LNPHFFGSTGRPLFGVHFAGHSQGRRCATQAVVLCYPWGQEYLRAHRSMRLLADMIAARGCDVLRFDYSGTGDSGGDATTASFVEWESDIETAIDELKDMAGVSRVSLVGLRLGATLAARVAERRRRDVSALVLWDPVVSGGAYLQELLGTAESREHTAERPVPRPDALGGGYELLGFVLNGASIRELSSIQLTAPEKGWPANTHIVVSQGPDFERPVQALAASTLVAATVAAIPTRPPWIETDQIMAGEVPVPVLNHIVDALLNGPTR
jgi:pimeloyl-ACP methyl ester carboxylesterase